MSGTGPSGHLVLSSFEWPLKTSLTGCFFIHLRIFRYIFVCFYSSLYVFIHLCMFLFIFVCFYSSLYILIHLCMF